MCQSLEVFRGEASRAREGLLERLVQNEEERDRYRHICVAELVRLLLQVRSIMGLEWKEPRSACLPCPTLTDHRVHTSS